MDGCPPLYSEEEIRTKIVTIWLVDHSFGPSDMSVEYSFEIRLSRKFLSINSEEPKKNSSQIFRPCADVLICSPVGCNLLIAEVNASNELLSDFEEDQSMCSARLLRKGEIAPFVVLTNGHDKNFRNHF